MAEAANGVCCQARRPKRRKARTPCDCDGDPKEKENSLKVAQWLGTRLMVNLSKGSPVLFEPLLTWIISSTRAGFMGRICHHWRRNKSRGSAAPTVFATVEDGARFSPCLNNEEIGKEVILPRRWRSSNRQGLSPLSKGAISEWREDPRMEHRVLRKLVRTFKGSASFDGMGFGGSKGRWKSIKPGAKRRGQERL